MRAMWTGAITFGLVVAPVRLGVAVSEDETGFHQVHDADGGRIKYKRFCDICGKEVSPDHIARGIELPDGTTEVMTDDDKALLDKAKGENTKTIDVVSFCLETEIDAIMYGKSYWVEPGKGGAHVYGLILETLRSQKKVAVCTFKLNANSRESLAIIKAHGTELVLIRLSWPDQIRAADFSNEPAAARTLPKAELAVAKQLVTAMSAPFDAAAFQDQYRMTAERIAETKALLGAGKAVAPAAAKPAAKADPDIRAALEASLAAMAAS